jgi:hypothetical protein
MYLIKEKIYGNMATVFHRTSVSDLVNKVYTTGFEPGSGDMYGKAFYSTYELESQQKSNMKSYGNIIVKFAVPIENFLIFDYSEFIKSSQYKKLGSPSEDSFLKAQFDYFNMEYDKDDDIMFPNKYTKWPRYSSELALVYYRSVKNFTKLCKGIIFTGQSDGHVLACYDPRIIVPLSYSTDEGLTFSSVELNKDYLRKVSVIKLSNYELPKEKPEDFLIYDYELTKDGLLNVYGDVNLLNRSLTKLPFKFGKVNGSFYCSYNKLTSLKGAPIEITGSFFCDSNKLRSLKYAPQRVGADFACYANNLITLEDAPSEVGHDFNCENNELISLKGTPKIVKGSFNCSHNNLTSLKDSPTKVEENYFCQFNRLTTLEGAPSDLGKNFKCENNELISLKGSPKIIKGSFDCSNNNLISLKDGPTIVEEDFYCNKNKLISLEGSPQEVKGLFNCSKNKLISIEGAPKETNDFDCTENDKKFSIEDILAVCKVKKYIH